MLLSKTQAERMGSNMGPRVVIDREEKRPQRKEFARKGLDAFEVLTDAIGRPMRRCKPDGRKARMKSSSIASPRTT